MDDRKYEELEPWEKAFYDLNMKIGNDAWGARLEGNGSGGQRLRVFINKEEFKEKVLVETKGKIAGYPLVFTVLEQQHYANSMQKKELREAIENAKEETAKQTETST